jgi:hypothetical protein
MWDLAKRLFFRSLVIFWSALMALAGALLLFLEPIAAFLEAPGVREQILTLIPNDAGSAARALLVISAITTLARFRGILAAMLGKE